MVQSLYYGKWVFPARVVPGIPISSSSKTLFINIYAPMHKHIHPSNDQSSPVSTEINTERRMTETEARKNSFNFFKKTLACFGQKQSVPKERKPALRLHFLRINYYRICNPNGLTHH